MGVITGANNETQSFSAGPGPRGCHARNLLIDGIRVTVRMSFILLIVVPEQKNWGGRSGLRDFRERVREVRRRFDMITGIRVYW